MAFEDACTQRDARERHLRTDAVVREADEGAGKRSLELLDARQRYNLGRRGVEVGALQERVVHAARVQDGDRRAQRLDRLHAGGHDDGLTKASDVSNQRQVVGLTGADLKGRNVDLVEEVGGLS